MVASSVFVNDIVQVLPNPYALSIKPRLVYCSYLGSVIIEKLQKEYVRIKQLNFEFYSQNEDLIKSHEFKKQVELELTLLCATEALKTIQNKMQAVSQIGSLAEVMSPLISVIRMINSNIYHDVPQASQDLIELSTTLGSIVMDSGSLVEAKFDFKQTNLESKQILAEVNLIAESKIRKQYPNLNF